MSGRWLTPMKRSIPKMAQFKYKMRFDAKVKGSCLRRFFARYCAVFCGLLIVAYQLSLLNTFSSIWSVYPTYWRVGFYGLWGGAALFAISGVILKRNVWNIILPVGAFCVFAVILSSFHSIGTITNNYFYNNIYMDI